MNKNIAGATIAGLAIVFFCSACARSPEAIKEQQYYAQGELLYAARCSNCHQKSGSGLGLLYPPLDKSDYLDRNFEAVVCLIKHGTKGELLINGNRFNKPMPGIPALTPLEIAEVTTYLYNHWGRHRGTVELDSVNAALRKCPD
jgi:cytochrome c551